MNFKQKIEEDVKVALKERQELRLSVLRMLSSAIHNKEIEKRSKTGKPEELTEEEIVAVLRSEVKKRRDAMVEFEKGGRKDLVEKESAELKVLEEYLPQELSDKEIEKIVREVTGQLGVVTEKYFGRVMGETMKKIKGQASGDRVSQAVRKVIGT